MRRGCISLGNIKCYNCQRLIAYPERYLAVEEKGTRISLCTDCCLKRGLAEHEKEKGESKVTFNLSS